MDIEQPDAPARKGRKAGKGDKPEDGDTKGKAKGSGKRFEIKKWNAVAMWSWAICTDTCAICRNNLYEPSIEYQVRSAESPLTQFKREAILCPLFCGTAAKEPACETCEISNRTLHKDLG